MYFILTRRIENDNTDAILEGESLYLQRLNCVFENGMTLGSEQIRNPILFKISEFSLRGTMTDNLRINSIPGPIFSLKTKNILEKVSITNIEYYHLELLDEFDEGRLKESKKDSKEEKKALEYSDYFIANVVGLADCVDHEKSVLEYFYPPELRNKEAKNAQENDELSDAFAEDNPNDIDFITKLVFDETKIDPKLKAFRLKDQPDLLVFHESIVSAIRKENLSGFVFVPVSEYTDAIPDDDDDTEDEEEKKNVDVKKGLPHPKQVDKPKEEKQTEELKIAKKSRFGFST